MIGRPSTGVSASPDTTISTCEFPEVWLTGCETGFLGASSVGLDRLFAVILLAPIVARQPHALRRPEVPSGYLLSHVGWSYRLRRRPSARWILCKLREVRLVSHLAV